MVTISLYNEKAAKAFVSNLKLFHLGGSLGGVEGLVEHVCVMSHGDWALSEQVIPAILYSSKLVLLKSMWF